MKMRTWFLALEALQWMGTRPKLPICSSTEIGTLDIGPEYLLLSMWYFFSFLVYFLKHQNQPASHPPVMFYNCRMWLLGVWVTCPELLEWVKLILISIWQGNNPPMDELLVTGLSSTCKNWYHLRIRCGAACMLFINLVYCRAFRIDCSP